MKRIIFFLLISLSLHAEPLVLSQAENVVTAERIEIGLAGNYSYDNWIQAVTNNDFTRREININLEVKYGFSNDVEIKTIIPYLSWKQTQTNSVDTSNEGIGVIAIGGKYNFFNDSNLKLKTAIALDFDMPTGDPAKELGKGLNTEVTGIGSMKIDPFDVHVNIGYKLTGAYINTNLVSVDMGDILKYGVAIEYPLSGSIIIIGEATGTSFSEYKVGGNAVAGTNGSTIDMLGGIRLNIDKTKFKLGLAFSVGDSSFRPYMWKLTLGQSSLF